MTSPRSTVPAFLWVGRGAAGSCGRLLAAIEAGEIDIDATRQRQRQLPALAARLTAEAGRLGGTGKAGSTPPRAAGRDRRIEDRTAKLAADRLLAAHTQVAARVFGCQVARVGLMGADDVGAALRPLINSAGGRDGHEVLVVVGLDQVGRAVTAADVATGNAHSVTFRGADLLDALAGSGAVAAFVAHQHPAVADPRPSALDVAMERQVAAVLAGAGIGYAGSLLVGTTRSRWSSDPAPPRRPVAVLDVQLGDGPAALGRVLAGKVGDDNAVVVAFDDLGRAVALADLDDDIGKLATAGAVRAVVCCRRPIHAPVVAALRSRCAGHSIRLVGELTVTSAGGEWSWP